MNSDATVVTARRQEGQSTEGCGEDKGTPTTLGKASGGVTGALGGSHGEFTGGTQPSAMNVSTVVITRH